MLIFFDTEFTDLHWQAKLISIGLVAEDGRTFYAELSDTYQVADCGDFAREAVVPLLDGGETHMTWPELSLRLGNWIEGIDQPVTLATDSLAWDWPWIQRLFAEPGTWPANLASAPEILLFDADPGEKFIDALELAFAGGLRRHHSLDDAKANRLGWIAAGGDIEQETRVVKTQEYRDQQRQLGLAETEWWKPVIANSNCMAEDEEYRKSIARDLS